MVVMQMPQSIMIKGMKMLGRKRFNMTLVSGSNSAYETKKMVSAALYSDPSADRFNASGNPAILAFPIFVPA